MVYWHPGNNVTFILYSACMKSVLKYLTTTFFCRSNNEGHLGYWRLFGYHPLSIHCHTLHSTGRPLLCCIHGCHPAGFHYPQPGKSCAFLCYQFPNLGTKSCSFQYVSGQKEFHQYCSLPYRSSSGLLKGLTVLRHFGQCPRELLVFLGNKLLTRKVSRAYPEQSWLERRETCVLKAPIDLN